MVQGTEVATAGRVCLGLRGPCPKLNVTAGHPGPMPRIIGASGNATVA